MASVTADMGVLRKSEDDGKYEILLIKRKNEPYKDCWALPGGFMEMNETLAAYSETHTSGIGIANTFRKEIGSNLLADDLMSNILLKVSSAAVKVS